MESESSRSLPDALHQRIVRLCEEGDEACEREEFNSAIAAYQEAWQLLPLPKEDWQAATFILVAMGDAYLSAGRALEAKEALQAAIFCPDGLGNPYIHLRLGQACFALQEWDQAADELARAYMGEGPEVFDEEDPKYLAFLRTRMTGI